MTRIKTVSNVLLAVFLVSNLFLIGGCGKSEKIMNGKNEIIRKPGTYRIEKQDIQITVWIEDLIVHYRVTKEEKTIIESIDKPSTTQRWFLCWDDKGWLWFDSSDIGGTLWRPDTATGRYTSIPLTADRELLKSMPNKVFSALPTTLQEQWQELRK